MTAMQPDGRPRAERLLEPGQRPGERQLERGWQPQRQPGVALAGGGYRYRLHC
jgi:FtsP/CotA-like multicopper oxidase with cupredoxin domain